VNIISGMVEFTTMRWANWFGGSKSLTTNKDAGLTAQASKVSHSPVASGSDITQTITEIHYHPQPERTFGATERPKATIRFAAANLIRIAESLDGGIFVQQNAGFTAAILRFSNDAAIGAENVAANLKATIIYRSAGKEILRVTGCWLEHAGGKIQFDVDDSHTLLVGVVLDNQLCVFEKREVTYARRHRGWITEKHVLGELQNGTVLVRLTASYSGYCYFEREFELGATPLAISAVLANG
jgi:hypothetical protein